MVAIQRRRPFLRTRSVAVASAVLVGLAVAGPPLRSLDLWSYAAYGRMVVEHRASPYEHGPADFPADPVMARVGETWAASPSVYGPAFTGASAAVMAVAGESSLVARLAFQCLAAAAVGLSLWLVRRRTQDPMAMAFVGLNPLTTVSVVNGGHNDALVGLALLVAVLLAADGRVGWAGAAGGAGVLVKVGGALPLAALGAWVVVTLGWRAAARFASAGAGVVGAGLVAAGGGQVLAPLEEARLRFTSGSVWAWPRRWLTGETGLTSVTAAAEPAVERIAAAAWASVAAMAALLAWARLGRLRSRPPAPHPVGDHTAAAAAVVVGAVVAYMLLGSYVAPWYLAWALPVLGLCWRSRLAWVAAAHGGLLLLTSLRSAPEVAEPARWLVVNLYRNGLPAFELVAAVLLVAAALHKLRAAGPPGTAATRP